MCGFAGLWGEWSEALDEAAVQMAARLRHRGPDDASSLCEQGARFAVAHRRLSILDLSESGRQPMRSSCGRWILAYNGEIYDDAALRSELASRGAQFRGSSDTEVVLEAISAFGIDAAVKRFNGMFAFAAWDRRERRLFLVRDRLGIKPLYYGLAPAGIAFGSELTAIERAPRAPWVIDTDAVASYLRHQVVSGPKSIYRDVFKVPPASIVEFRSPDAGPTTRQYWAPASAKDMPRDDYREAVEHLDQLIEDAVRIRLRADVPVGAFLSGGLDSSSVAAAARRAVPIKTFCLGFDDPALDESDNAREVARRLGTTHFADMATEAAALDIAPMVPAVFDEPFGDPSAVAMMLVARSARRHVTVCLAGDGGDELFLGYERYRWGARRWTRVRRVPRTARYLAARVARLPTGLGRTRRAAAVLGASTPEQVHRHYLSVLTAPHDFVKGSRPESPPATFDHPDYQVAAARHDLETYLPDDILTKVDRATMAVSLEARVPLLDHRVVDYALSLPAAWRYRKRLLADVVARSVPRAAVERPKRGFGVPMGRWLRGGLRPWAEELLSEAHVRKCNVLRPAPVRDLWRAHLEGRRDNAHALWVVLALQAWLSARLD